MWAVSRPPAAAGSAHRGPAAAKLSDVPLPTSLPTWSQLLSSPAAVRAAMRFWPPYAAAGIRLVELADDYSSAVVELRLRPWTANFVGTAFGGSLFAMADPWWMLLMMRRLGPDYVVWDKAGEIDFHAPGRADVRLRVEVTDAMVEQVRAAAAGGQKVLQWYAADIVTADGTRVATVRKQLYIREKQRPPTA